MKKEARGKFDLLYRLKNTEDVDWSALADSIEDTGMTLIFKQNKDGSQVPYLAWYEDE